MFNTTTGKETVLYSFTGANGDGKSPFGSLTLSGTTLYGMTEYGGAYGNGTIFQINTSGAGYQVLYSFLGTPDGEYPVGSLTLSGTTLYGMTSGGGAYGYGTIFTFDTATKVETVLYSFAEDPDGAYPFGSLTLSGTTLYGMTESGGADGYGTIFKINTDGAGYEVLHNFGPVLDGASPYGSLILSGTTLYGMTQAGGPDNYGTVFQINTSGAGYQVLYSFAGEPSDGSDPE